MSAAARPGAAASSIRTEDADEVDASLALADVLLGGIEERRLRALHVREARAERHELVGAQRDRCVADAGAERDARVVQAEEGDEVALVGAVARGRDAADQRVAAIDREAAAEQTSCRWAGAECRCSCG